MAKKQGRVITKGARWKGIVVKHSAIHQAFEYIRENQGFSRYDMSGDDAIKQVLNELFELGKATGREGMRIKYKLP